MNGARQKWDADDELHDKLESAALRVHFGDANDELTNQTTVPSINVTGDDHHTIPLQRQTAKGLLLSVAIHTLVVLLCAFVATDIESRLDAILDRDAIVASFSDRDFLDEDALVPHGSKMILDPSSGPAASQQILPASIVELTDDGPPQTISPEDVAPAFADDGKQKNGTGSGGVEEFRYQKPQGGRSITKGSFTVWTEPLDPIPNQPYIIVVQFRVPEGLDSFPKSDLVIDVVGTDNFHLRLPDPRRGFKLIGELPVINSETQLLIPIPGADSLVQDAIQIESRKILEEKQSMLIEF
ncbi:MAG: hypothetical protein P8M30_08090 [Planctomycetaceae bacterium]|jgi:hypothetical protein|nr:hypothetical protein [Planctomycetaceae bacterium]MDG2389266.1 hypothetical protein [Planctomycetaceae bacterium]